MVDVAALTDQLAAALVRDRPVVVWCGFLAGATALVAQLESYGAHRPLVVAGGTGTGSLPPAGSCEVLVLHLPPASTVSEQVRHEGRLVGTPPPEALAAVEAYDPHARAVVLSGPFTTARHLGGRPVLDGRPPAWEALEDKTLADELCDAAGVPRPSSMVVPAEDSALRAAAARLDHGDGTVWSGDASEGMNGGADLVRRVGPGVDPAVVAAFLAAHCRRVRVAPFVEGIPCSIHGLVTPDGVAVLRPVEMVILRGPQVDRFTYAGAATWWDPPESDREAMRSHARAMGVELAARVGYRGGFSLDGVLGRDGFVATEVNPRFTGGLALLARTLPGLPMTLVQAALVSGVDLGVDAVALEATLLPVTDAHRVGGTNAVSTAVHPEATVSVDVVVDQDHALRRAGDDEESLGTLELGPSSPGGLVRLAPGDGLVPRGTSVAPYAVGALALADELWGTGFGPLHAARRVR
jgi:hypothetical protein